MPNPPPGITPTTATTAHSPNRRPRYRRQMRSHTRLVQKEAAVGAYILGLDTEGAARAAMVTPNLVRYWELSDPEFRLKAAEAKEMARIRAEGQLDKSLGAFVCELVTILTSPETSAKVKMEGLLAVMRGRGVLVDRQQTEVKGAVAIGTADDWFRVFREAQREFDQVGGESLGVPDGGGAGR